MLSLAAWVVGTSGFPARGPEGGYETVLEAQLLGFVCSIGCKGNLACGRYKT